MVIRLEYPELNQLTKELRRQEEAFQYAARELKRLIYSADSYWEGQAAEAYIHQFADLEPGFEKASEIVALLAKQLYKTMETMDETDKKLAVRLDF